MAFSAFGNHCSTGVSLLVAYADDITVFVSHRLDKLAVKKAVVRYEEVTGAKINFDKSEGLRLGAWRDSVFLPGPFRWNDRPVRIRGVWFGHSLQLERNWSEVRAKVEAQVGLSVLLLPTYHRMALKQSFYKLLWKGRSLMARRQVCYQRPRNGGLGMPDLESHRLAERLAYLSRSLSKDTVWGKSERRLSPPEVQSQGRRSS